MIRNGQLSAFILLTALITGCAQTPSQPAPESEPASIASTLPAEKATTLPAEKGSFEASTLYGLLVAELANQRGLPRVTLHNYLQEAHKTKDIGVITRAVELANSLQDSEKLLEASLIWVEVEPNNPIPFTLATKELIRQGDVKNAAPLLEKSLQLNSIEVIDTLASRGQAMSDKERQTYLSLFDDLLEKEPENPYFLYAKASLLTHEKAYDQALTLTKKALFNAPSYDRAILLEADLHARLGHIDTAIGHLREQLNKKDHKQFRTLYTRLLLETDQYPEAEKQADILARANPNDENLLYHLGLLMLEHERLDLSERYLSQVEDIIGFNGALRFYQGRIAQLRGNKQQAIEYYANVDDSRFFISSYTEIGNILHRSTDQQQLAEIFALARQRTPDYAPLLYSMESNWLTEHELNKPALALLNQALEEHPTDMRLLYTRAMLWEQFNKLTAMEADLKKLLQSHPDNATALNALGYTLTERTDRHEEAKQLISKALALKPEDPAILDSMGWVLHNLGDYAAALAFLKKAHDIFPDPEIAAHLGTVYWKLGDKASALNVWDTALKDNPDHKLLVESRAQAGQ